MNEALFEAMQNYLTDSLAIDGVRAEFIEGTWTFCADRELSEEEVRCIREFASRFVVAAPDGCSGR